VIFSLVFLKEAFFYISDAPCQCGIANNIENENTVVNRIINGDEALPNEFPWQVALVDAGGHTPFCGGSVISDRYVSIATLLTLTTEHRGRYKLY
jgi:hypothetical protein